MSIGSDTPADAVHRLRIDSKKLRYLLEIFRSLYDPRIASLIKELKKLQDHLGDFNDLEVQQKSLVRLAKSMLLDGANQAGTVMAMGRLVEQLEERQSHERAAFHTHFDKFARKRNRKLFRELFDRREKAPK
jgi:CHAD domain-containing protein